MGAEITRELLQASQVTGLPEWETRLFLITYPPGADASNHSIVLAAMEAAPSS
jgi:hypothetical protein